jgi:hypothetical protein
MPIDDLECATQSVNHLILLYSADFEGKVKPSWLHIVGMPTYEESTVVLSILILFGNTCADWLTDGGVAKQRQDEKNQMKSQRYQTALEDQAGQ